MNWYCDHWVENGVLNFRRHLNRNRRGGTWRDDWRLQRGCFATRITRINIRNRKFKKGRTSQSAASRKRIREQAIFPSSCKWLSFRTRKHERAFYNFITAKFCISNAGNFAGEATGNVTWNAEHDATFANTWNDTIIRSKFVTKTPRK